MFILNFPYLNRSTVQVFFFWTFEVLPRVHPLVQLKRASRSLTKTSFLVSIEDFRQKLSLKASKLSFMLDLILGGVLQASWGDLGES